MAKSFFDNTKLSDYKKCPRKYYLRHERGWRKQGTAAPLVFGLSWHEGMDTVWQGYGKVSNEDLVELAMYSFGEKWAGEGYKPIDQLDFQDLEMLGARTPMNAKEMFRNYIEQREGILTNMTLVAAERPFAVPLYPDRTDIWYIGRRDKDIIINGDRVVIEHKTTTEYKVDGGFKSSYVESWYPNSQCEGYLYASNIEYGNVKQVWVDAALVHKKVHDCFKFIPVGATFAALDAWLWEARDWVERVESERERLLNMTGAEKVLTAFPKNTEQCCDKYGMCSFIDICRGYPNPEQLREPPAGFIFEPWNPFDLLHIADIGLTQE